MIWRHPQKDVTLKIMKIQKLHHHDFLPFLCGKLHLSLLIFFTGFNTVLVLKFNKLKP